jgi:hypothetical protein
MTALDNTPLPGSSCLLMKASRSSLKPTGSFPFVPSLRPSTLAPPRSLRATNLISTLIVFLFSMRRLFGPGIELFWVGEVTEQPKPQVTSCTNHRQMFQCQGEDNGIFTGAQELLCAYGPRKARWLFGAVYTGINGL